MRDDTKLMSEKFACEDSLLERMSFKQERGLGSCRKAWTGEQRRSSRKTYHHCCSWKAEQMLDLESDGRSENSPPQALSAARQPILRRPSHRSRSPFTLTQPSQTPFRPSIGTSPSYARSLLCAAEGHL